MKDLQDVELLHMFRQGNEKALKIIYDRWHTGMVYFGNSFIADYTIVEDIIAELYVTLWNKRQNFDNLYAIRSFLFVSIRNASINHIKRMGRVNGAHDRIRYSSETVVDPTSRLSQQANIKEIWDEVEKLPAARQKIFRMLFEEDMTTWEVARNLNISIDTVRVQKARAIKTIREKTLLGTV